MKYMKKITRFVLLLLLPAVFAHCSYSQSAASKKTNNMDTSKKNPVFSKTDTKPVNVSDEEWRKILPAEVYNVARQKGTERPWTSVFENSKEMKFCLIRISIELMRE